MKFEESLRMQKRFNDIIPGGCHTYAKGDDQYPEFMPAYIARGKGSHVWDVDGNEYIEYGMGLRSVTLGHAFGAVVEAASEQMALGNNYVRPARIELRVPPRSSCRSSTAPKWSSSARTAPTPRAERSSWPGLTPVGTWWPSAATTPSSRSTTGSSAATAISAGIPECVRDLTVKFHYNDLDSVRAAFRQISGEDRLLILEAEKVEPPKDRLPPAACSRLVHDNGAVLHPRRDDHGVPLAPGRGPEEIRHRAGPLDVRQGPGQRVCACRRWPASGTSWNGGGSTMTRSGFS